MKRPPFLILYRQACYELENIERFVALSGKVGGIELQALEKAVSELGDNELDDWLTDDFTSVDDFNVLSSEFSIVGLWRCIELFRTKSITIALGSDAAKRVFTNKEFIKCLLNLNITEADIQHYRPIDELRCLNNCIKHEQVVGAELADHDLWKGMEGDRLGNLENHYKRLSPLANIYLKDFTGKLNVWWKENKA